MKLAILSRAPQAYSTQRLRAAALQRGHDVKVLNTLRFAIDLSGAEPDLQYRGRPLSRLRRDPAAHRQLDHLLRHRRRAPVRADGRLHAEHRERHHERARQAAREPDPVPAQHRRCRRRRSCATAPTCAPRSSASAARPVVIKLLEGTQGIGVILAPEVKVAEAIIETLHSTKQNVLIQRFVAREPRPRHPRPRRRRPRRRGDAPGRDGRRVPLERAPRRHRRAGRADARVRAGRGALGADHGPEGRRRRHARGQRRPARHGGELLAGPRGHRDGDASSTSRARSSTTSPTRSRSPRSTCASGSRVSTGYGVAELLVHGDADLIGKTLGESGLWERDITVLTLHRGTTRDPEPAQGRRARGRATGCSASASSRRCAR